MSRELSTDSVKYVSFGFGFVFFLFLLATTVLCKKKRSKKTPSALPQNVSIGESKCSEAQYEAIGDFQSLDEQILSIYSTVEDPEDSMIYKKPTNNNNTTLSTIYCSVDPPEDSRIYYTPDFPDDSVVYSVAQDPTHSTNKREDLEIYSLAQRPIDSEIYSSE
ncbi:hypothetical protein DNTS_031446 [Danionella cerebrum]|uniref:Uncharacterized protein n=1 Tax=Danionella cerebrum TaxID=2873325 RepID=A0A553QQ80_9TELE|nr:hypothetical protein DNTS_031446 [Danionella translucida]